MNDIQYQALREFKHIADREDPEFIFEAQKNVTSVLNREQKRYRKKLKNPVHYATGKPLTQSTMGKYKASIESTKTHLVALELAIEMLKKYGFLGNGRKSINEVLALYPGEISKEDKPWIEVLRGIKKARDERKADREKLIHRIRTCTEECPLKEFFSELTE